MNNTSVLFSYDYFSLCLDELEMQGCLPTQELHMDDETDVLLKEIQRQMEEIKENGHTPSYVLLNKGNYERLIAHSISSDEQTYTMDSFGRGLPDEFLGCRLILWEVPVDYVNVRANASTEYAFEGNLGR